MKNRLILHLIPFLFLLVQLFFTKPINAQQKIYGDPADQIANRVIPFAQGFYVLGQEDGMATITRLNQSGGWIWTYRLAVQSALTDGVVLPNNSLMVVGFTFPLNLFNKSIIGEISLTGSTYCFKVLDQTGFEALSRIKFNGSTYTAVGVQTDPFTLQDVVIFDLSPGCVINSKKLFNSLSSDEFANDLEIIGGDFYVAGKIGNSAVIYQHLLSTGASIGGVQSPGGFTYTDLEAVGTEILAIANPLGSGQPRIMRFGANLFPAFWEVEVFGVSSLNQIVELNGEIYVVGTAVVSGLSRAVIIRIDDTNGPQLVWAKYMDDGETNYIGGTLAILPTGSLSFVDGREHGSGHGLNDIYLSITDDDLTTICTETLQLDLNVEGTLFESPEGLMLDFYDVPPQMSIEAEPLMWVQKEICAIDTCNADYIFQYDNACGLVSFTNLSSGAPNLTYCWDFDDDGICESTATNPTFQYPMPPCQNYKAVLTITDGNGCTDTYWQVVSISESIPPSITCPPNLTLSCIDDTTPSSTGFATATDNCTSTPFITYSDNLTGTSCNSIIERTWTATDICLNISTCTQYITVIDNTPPIFISCSGDITVNSNTISPCNEFLSIPIPSVSDDCSPPVTLMNSHNLTSDASGLYPGGTTIITWTATDDCGNSSTCTFSVTVNCNPFCGFKCGQAIVSYSSTAHSSQTGHVMEVIDLTANNGPVVQNWNNTEENWNAPICHHPDWTVANLGHVFGIAIDKNNDVFVTATKTYEFASHHPSVIGAGGTGGIYKISHVTGAVSTFVQTDNNSGAPCGVVTTNDKIPNSAINGPGLGNIAYDEVHDQFFVTNFEDGKIYQIDAITGDILDCFDPFNPAGTTGGVEPYDEMIWGIGVLTTNNSTTLYFGRWRNDYSHNGNVAGVVIQNEIHSIVLPGGNFPPAGTPTLVIPIPINNTWAPQMTNPISDIEFSDDGTKMLVSESASATYSTPFFYTTPYAGFGRVLEYDLTTSTLSRIYRIGSAHIHQNGAGGVDYGYQGIDPSTGNVYDCDNMIWTTGDDLDLTDPNITNYGITGLAGIPVGAINTPSQLNNYYIDLDGKLDEGAADQRDIGDIDIFKCGCPTLATANPCESVFATVASSGAPGECRWALSLGVQEDNISHIEIEAITPGVNINTFNLTSNTFGLNIDGRQITRGIIQIQNNTAGDIIEKGSYADIAEFSIGNIDQMDQQPQRVVVRWFVDGTDGSLLFCSDTIIIDCPPPSVDEACLSISVISTTCNLSQQSYNVLVDITNLSDSSFTHVAFEDTNLEDPFTLVSPQIYTLSEELLPGATTGPIEIILHSSQFIINAEEKKLNLMLLSALRYCRPSSPFSVVVESCCTPCEGTSVTFDPEFSDPDACIFTLDIDNHCAANYFTRIETEIITPGLVFSETEVSASSSSPWYFAFGSNREVHWTPVGGFVPFGILDNLIQFGLTDILDESQFPQMIEIRWIAKDENGEEFVACSETITLTCQPAISDSCIILVDHLIECLPDGSQIIHFTIENNSEHTISDFSVYEIDPSQVTITSSIFSNVDLKPDERWSDVITVIGSESGGQLNLNFQFSEQGLLELDDLFYAQWRCFEDLSFLLPDCVTSIEDIEEEHLKIYPNPTTGKISVELGRPALKNTTIRILSTSGSALLEKNVDPGKTLQLMETSQLAEGMYFIQIITENHILAFDKFVKL